MTQVVNLNKARKARAKTDAARTASENRVKFGRPKAETELQTRRRDKAAKALDDKKRE